MLKINKIITFFNILPRQKIIFLFINLLVSATGFIRSFVFMKVLNFNDLGMLTIFQTIIMFVGMMQFGLINGGYRMFALDIKEQNKKLNNLLFSYFLLLTFILFLIWIGSLSFNIKISEWYILFTLFIGIQTLVVTWLTNTLIGSHRIANLNQINFWSALTSLLLLPLAFIWGLKGAFVTICVQPMLFISLALLFNHDLRPTQFLFEKKLIREILRYGFIPFVAGIFAVVNLQIERWAIVNYLGIEQLGKFYLVFLYSTLYTLIPTSILSIFFPLCIKSFADFDLIKFRSYLLKHFLIIIGYSASIIIITIIFLHFFISLLLPQHSDNVKYVFYILPGLVAITLCDPIALILNSVVRLRPILIGGMLIVVVNLILIVIALKTNTFSLSSMAMIKSGVNFSMLSYYLLYIFLNRHNILLPSNEIR